MEAAVKYTEISCNVKQKFTTHLFSMVKLNEQLNKLNVTNKC
jgi:hypothetical protein